MRAGLSILGWTLLVLTALSLVGELATRGLYDAREAFLSAEELWAALAPESFAVFRSWFRSSIRPLWTYGFGPLLKLPAWALFGLPGLLATAYACRLNREPIDYDPSQAFLYDELAQRAREEGYVDAKDRAPEDDTAAIAASAREAEADLARDPIVPPPPEAGAKAVPPTMETDIEPRPPLSRPPS
jgi:hypothetical protein